MSYKESDVSYNRTLRASIWTTIRSEVTQRLMLKFTVIREYLGASKIVILAR